MINTNMDGSLGMLNGLNDKLIKKCFACKYIYQYFNVSSTSTGLEINLMYHRPWLLGLSTLLP